MRLLGAFLLALALAVGVGQWLSHDPGLVTITYGGRLVRMSVGVAAALAIAGSLAAFFVVRTVWQMVTLRGRWRRWRATRERRRNHARLSDGLLALAAGEHARAEQLLSRARGDDATAAHYLAAAQAAHAQAAPTRRDGYLALAREFAPRQALPIALQQIEMQLATGELQAADDALTALERTHRDHRQVLALRHRQLAASGAWDDVAALLPRLKRNAGYSDERLTELEAECAARILARPYPTHDALSAAWQALPKPIRAEPAVLAAYVRRLLAYADQGTAEGVLRKALNARWDPRLVALYGELQPPTAQLALKHAEQWRAAHAGDPALLLALGRLCLAAGLWGKAREYLEAALAAAPDVLTHRLLADALERLQEPAAAARHRQLGLELATTHSALPALTRA